MLFLFLTSLRSKDGGIVLDLRPLERRCFYKALIFRLSVGLAFLAHTFRALQVILWFSLSMLGAPSTLPFQTLGLPLSSLYTCAFPVNISTLFEGGLYTLIQGLSNLLLHVLGLSRIRHQCTLEPVYSKACTLLVISSNAHGAPSVSWNLGVAGLPPDGGICLLPGLLRSRSAFRDCQDGSILSGLCSWAIY